VDLQLQEDGPLGALAFEAHEGSLAAPGLGMALPYQHNQGELEFGGEAFATVKLLKLEGPVLNAEVTGTLGKARSFASARLALTARLDVKPAIRALFQSAGIRVSRDGSARIRISGTPAKPVLR
jgi:hypothetical protein